MAKIVSETGEEKLHLIGVAEPQERGVKGLLGAVHQSCESTREAEAPKILKNVSSIVTDGATVNTGQKAGLWTLFDEKLKKLSEEEVEDGTVLPPLLKIWCAAHR